LVVDLWCRLFCYTAEKECCLLSNQKIHLRKVCYQEEKNGYCEFMTNNLEMTAEEVAILYSVAASLLRIHLNSMLDMDELLRCTSREYKMKVGEAPGEHQLSLI